MSCEGISFDIGKHANEYLFICAFHDQIPNNRLLWFIFSVKCQSYSFPKPFFQPNSITLCLFLVSFSVGRWRVRYGTELRHSGCPKYQTHAGAVGSLSAKFTGKHLHIFQIFIAIEVGVRCTLHNVHTVRTHCGANYVQTKLNRRIWNSAEVWRINTIFLSLLLRILLVAPATVTRIASDEGKNVKASRMVVVSPKQKWLAHTQRPNVWYFSSIFFHFRTVINDFRLSTHFCSRFSPRFMWRIQSNWEEEGRHTEIKLLGLAPKRSKAPTMGEQRFVLFPLPRIVSQWWPKNRINDARIFVDVVAVERPGVAFSAAEAASLSSTRKHISVAVMPRLFEENKKHTFHIAKRCRSQTSRRQNEIPNSALCRWQA